MNFHSFTGYADSTEALMSEDGAVTDATFVYNYIKQYSKDSMVVVWGHSLGTGWVYIVIALKYTLNANTCVLLELLPERWHIYVMTKNRPIAWFWNLRLIMSGMRYEIIRSLTYIVFIQYFLVFFLLIDISQ